MQRYGNLKELILDPDNLCLAFHRAAQGKRDRRDVRVFQADLAWNLFALRRALTDSSLRFGAYRFFRVRDPKERSICAAAFEERVAHHALINIAGPMLDRSQLYHSYACRRGKGQHKALAQAAQWAGKAPYYLKMDIRKYFDSIRHETVLELLGRRFKDVWVLRLFSEIIASYETSPGRGLPLGNLTSQYLANFYLDSFDHWITEQAGAGRYLRYMDDMLLFGDKAALLSLRKQCRDFLEERPGLELKNGGQINRTEKGIGFLGSVVFPGRIRLSQGAKKRIRAKLNTYHQRHRSGQWDALELQSRTRALWAGLDLPACPGWRKQLAGSCPEV